MYEHYVMFELKNEQFFNVYFYFLNTNKVPVLILALFLFHSLCIQWVTHTKHIKYKPIHTLENREAINVCLVF